MSALADEVEAITELETRACRHEAPDAARGLGPSRRRGLPVRGPHGRTGGAAGTASSWSPRRSASTAPAIRRRGRHRGPRDAGAASCARASRRSACTRCVCSGSRTAPAHDHDGTAAIADHIADLAPDRIVTFGPDGITEPPRSLRGEPMDDRRLGRDLARDRRSGTRRRRRSSTDEFAEVNEGIGLWNDQPEPPCTPSIECCVAARSTRPARSQDRGAPRPRALRRCPLIELMGDDLYRAWVQDRVVPRRSSRRVASR